MRRAVIAACVIELALRQGDRFGIVVIGGDGVAMVPAGGGPRQRDRCLLELHRLRGRGLVAADGAAAPGLGAHRRRRTWCCCSAIASTTARIALAEQLAAARREVLTVQILTAEERDFPFRGRLPLHGS